MPELPNNAFDFETTCSTGELQIGSADGATTIKLFVKAAKGTNNSQCDIRLEKRNPNPANPAGPPVITPVPGTVKGGTGQFKFINLAANQELYVKCLGENPAQKCRFTVTFFG